MKFPLSVPLLVALGAFGCAHSPGQAAFNFSCHSEEFRKTTASVRTEGERVHLEAKIDGDKGKRPVTNGLVVLSDLKVLQANADFVAKLPVQIRLSWPRSACKKFGPDLFECNEGEAAFYTSASVTRAGNAITSTHELEIIFYGDKIPRVLSLIFPHGACSFD